MFQLKYYYTFKGLENDNYKVEIYQDTTGTLTAQEIRGDENPFSIEYPDCDKFTVIRGSGAELNLLSETDRQFLDLYTANMLEYQVRFYKNNVLHWLGYLDSELYNEAFTDVSNYTVKFTATDGFALLERFNYVDVNGNKYQGLVTQWQVLENCINKLNLPYSNIYVCLSTTSNNFSLNADETLLHKTYCNSQNWYNEDGDPETCRTVLESILMPYAAIILQDNSNLYIIDVNTLAKNTNANFLKFNSSFNYVSTVGINLALGDLSSIKFASNDANFTVIAGFNQQVIKYSPYIEPTIINFRASTDFTDASYTSATIGTSPYQWTETIYASSNSWTASNNGMFASYQGVNVANQDKTDSYLKLTKYAVNQAAPQNLSFTYKKELPLIIPANCKLRVNCKAFVRMSDNLEGADETQKIAKLKLRTRLKIGDKQFYNDVWNISGRVSGWISSTSTDYDKCFQLEFEEQTAQLEGSYTYAKNSAIDDKWVDLKLVGTNGGGGMVNKDVELIIYNNDILIPLNTGFAGGQMQFEIYDFDIVTMSPNIDYTTTRNEVKDIRIKDLQLTIVDSKGNEIKNEDVEYIGYMNKYYKNAGSKITTIQGTSKIQNSIEKAALIGKNTNYYFLNSWVREGKTDCIENLLLRSIVSNYTNKTIELTATINLINSIVGSLKYQNIIPDKVFQITGIKQDFAENLSSVKLQEINIDNLDINKSF